MGRLCALLPITDGGGCEGRRDHAGIGATSRCGRSMKRSGVCPTARVCLCSIVSGGKSVKKRLGRPQRVVPKICRVDVYVRRRRSRARVMAT